MARVVVSHVTLTSLAVIGRDEWLTVDYIHGRKANKNASSPARISSVTCVDKERVLP